jgi:hypothetical protein
MSERKWGDVVQGCARTPRRARGPFGGLDAADALELLAPGVTGVTRLAWWTD